MAETNTLRLAKAGATYNVSQDHILSALKKAKFELTGGPNEKLTPEMIAVLDEEFGPDKSLRQSVLNQRIKAAIGQFLLDPNGRLNLSGLGLTYIPVEVTYLQNLKSLDLSKNRLTDIKELEYISGLTSLSLANNKITHIHNIQHLNSLENLNLENNKVEDLMPIYNLYKLKTLNLNGNFIADIALVQNMPNLRSLKVNKTGLTNISQLALNTELEEISATFNLIDDISALSELKGLSILHLKDNNINDIKPLEYLTKLEELNLENNEISDISALTNLHIKELNIGGNHIKNIPEFSKKQLRSLLADRNLIKQISTLKDLAFLKTLVLDFNEIEEIGEIGTLKELTHLSIVYNIVSDISPLKSCKNLITLFITGNPISNLTPLLKLKQLLSVVFEPTNLNIPVPAEVIHSGWPAVAHYLTEMGKAKVLDRISLNEAKILLLGNTNVGKSNLLEYWETDEKPTGNKSTLGLNYKEVTDVKNLCELEEGDNANFHFWDFGGQEYFHATHKLFFSTGALHIVLWSQDRKLRPDQVDETCFDLNYWLRCIQQLSSEHAPKSVEAVLVENKIDLQKFRTAPLPQPEFDKNFPELNLSYAAVSLTEMKRLKGLKELIVERIKTLPTFQRKEYTIRYKLLLDLIRDLNRPVLEITEIEKHSFKEDEIKAMLPVFHNMGVLLYFGTALENKIFVQPLALLELLYNKILNEKAKDQRGKLTKQEITNAISGNELGLSIEDVLALMKHFDLIFQVKDNDDCFYAPQYLAKSMHGYLQFFLSHNFKNAPIKITCDNYLMNIALLKTFSKYGKSIKNDGNENLFWKDGIVIEEENQILLVRFDNENQSIFIYDDIQGDNFSLSKEVIDFILDLPNESEKEITAQKDNDDIDWHLSQHFSVQISDGHNYASYKKIRTSYENKLYKFEEDGNTFSTFDFKKYFPSNSLLFMKKIFISYSAEDGKFRNDLEKHLSALKRSGYIETWHCGKLIPGQKWDETIKKHFDEADIVLFLISPDFMATDYIHDIEIQKAFDRHKNEKDHLTIVPIIIRYCDWETQLNNLQDFDALPYKAKPIKSFDDQDKAWYTVIERLKWIISKEKYTLPKEVLAIELEFLAK